MIIGVLSDTHGHARRAGRAAALLRAAGAQFLIHCGDIGGSDVLEALAGGECGLVWGNTDEADPREAEYARSLGLHLAPRAPLRLQLGGRGLLVFHGHEAEFAATVRQLIATAAAAPGAAAPGSDTGRGEAGVDYVFHGHTHAQRDERIGATRIINPGALQRAAEYTVALLDLDTDDLKFLSVAP